jgi:predicted nuclease with TOPRIM domain
MGTIISFFTGNLWVWICVAVAGVALACGLYVADLKHVISTQADTITKQITDIKNLQNELVTKRSEIEAQNARVKQMEVDKKANEEKAEKEKVLIQTKYENLRNSLNFKVDENASNANDVKLFVNGFHWVR